MGSGGLDSKICIGAPECTLSHFAGQNPVDESSIKPLMVVAAVVNVFVF